MGSFGGIGGLGAGFDVAALVNQILFFEREPVRQIQFQQTRLNLKAAALRGINDKLSELLTKINDLKDLSGTFNTKATISSDTNILTASASSSAVAGIHTIEITALAKISTVVASQAFFDGDTNGPTGTGIAASTLLQGGRTLSVSDGTNPDASFTTVLNEFTVSTTVADPAVDILDGGSQIVLSTDLTGGNVTFDASGKTLNQLAADIDAHSAFTATVSGSDLIIEAEDGTRLTVDGSSTLQISSVEQVTSTSETRALSTLEDVRAGINGDANFTATLSPSGNFFITADNGNAVTIATNTLTDAATSSQSETFNAIGTGQFTIQVGNDSPVTVTVDSSNNTLNGIASTINGLGLDVTASVITDADGARLSIVSKTSGSAGDLIITQDGADPVEGLTFNEVVAGTDATLTVDGISIVSTSNTVTGAIPGVTLNLLNTSPSGTQVTLTVESDSTEARKALDDFVTDFNALVNDINAQFAYNTVTKTGGTLSGETSVRLVQGDVLIASTFSITGNNGFVNLSTIGIDTNTDGTLSINSTELDDFLESNFDDVKTFVEAFATNFSTKLDDLTDSINGSINIALNGITDTQTTLTDQIRTFEDRLELRRVSLTEEFSRINTLLQQLPLLQAQIANQLGALR